MRIYRMTATFGKLEHATLTLEPGLNVIHAPNEWGKSTWCAFLLAMLYGLDTRAKTTKTSLADKERFAPWSGSPMAGSMDISWKGRDITIQRATKGRTPLGEFRAFETRTGLPVPELTAANCGQMLLGVEQSVFRRGGFIPLSDLPVTADENLRRRLNALVTTGDESGDGERLARELRELRNRCRYNRSGLIPQTQAQRDEVEKKLQELESLETHSRKLKNRLAETNCWLRQLSNHRDALAYAGAEADALRVAQARDAYDRASAHLMELDRACANLPAPQEAEEKIQALRAFQKQWDRIQLEQQLVSNPPEAPEVPQILAGKTPEQAENMVGQDLQRYELLTRTKPWLVWLLLSGAGWVLAILGALSREYSAAAIAAAWGLVFLPLALGKRSKWRAEAAALAAKYGSEDPQQWRILLQNFETGQKEYAQALRVHRADRGNLDLRLNQLQMQRASLCGEQSPEKVMEIWQKTLGRWDAYDAARQEVRRMEQHLQAVQAMARTAPPPAMADDLCYTETETDQLMAEAQQEQQRLQNRLGQYQGRMEALGTEMELRMQLDRVESRLKKLEDTYTALTIALETLNETRLELQRRFAPRIVRRAQELLAAMTQGRYERLTLGEDFSLQAAAEQEDVLHDALWRSAGTVDQLYLALRLAVAEALTPEAPLVLDDALARFDEDRMKSALHILQEEAKTKQVILFSCQKREQDAVKA